MVTIRIDNSYSQIIGLKTEDFRKLRKLLSYSPNSNASYYTGGYSYVTYLLDKKGFFPTGLFDKVNEFLMESNIPRSITDIRMPPRTNTGSLTLKKEVSTRVWQRIAVNNAMHTERGGIVAPTGTGKSLVIALLVGRLNVRTLIVVPTLEIKKQLSNSLTELYGANPNIVVENIDSSALKTAKDFDCLIIDECHHAAAKTYHKLNRSVWNGIYYRFFLTATFFRNQENEQLLFEGIAGQPIYRLSQKEAVEKGYIVPVEAYYYDLPKQETDAYTWRQVYDELVVRNSGRNVLISSLLFNLNKDRQSTLCLVKEIAHGKKLSELTGLPFASGEDDTSKRFIQEFNTGKIKCLIATTGVCGEGIDTKPAEYIIIAGLGKAKSAFLQQIGRGVRTYPGKESCKVVLFRDKSHKFTLRHFNVQRRILLEELGIQITKLGRK